MIPIQRIAASKEKVMPPVMAMPPYTEEDIDRIIQNISRGVYEPSIFPSGVIQLHLPNITLGNVVNIYPNAARRLRPL